MYVCVCVHVCFFLCVCICGTDTCPARLCVCVAQAPLFAASRVLAGVDAAAALSLHQQFLPQVWTLAKRVGLSATAALLYSSTRDGLCAKAFRDKCRYQTNTVTLVRSAAGHVFGACTLERWEGDHDDSVGSRCRAFLFSVVGPRASAGPLFYHSNLRTRMSTNAADGPCFGLGDFGLRSHVPGADFDDASLALCPHGTAANFSPDDWRLRVHYDLTGTPHFTPLEVEVFQLDLLFDT